MAYNSLSPSEQLALSKRPSADFIGVDPTEEVLEWLWGNQFAAVAGDAPAFERSPVGGGTGKDDVPPPVVLHQWLLGGWGMPIGEMFDLEELARHCRENGRWSFFLSSVPLKASGFQLFAFLMGKLVSVMGRSEWNTGSWRCGQSAECCRYLLVRGGARKMVVGVLI